MTNPSIATLDIGSSKPIIFKSWQELDEWLKQESENWAFLNNENSNGYTFQAKTEISNKIQNAQNAIQQLISSIEQNPDDKGHLEQMAIRVLQILSNVETNIKTGKYILSESLLGKSIRKIAEGNPRKASHITNVAINRNANSNFPQTIEVIQAAALLEGIERGWDKTTTAQAKRSIKALDKEYTVKISALEKDAQDRIEYLDNAIEERRVKVQQSTHSLANILRQHKSNTRKDQDQLRSEIKNEAGEVLETTKQELESFKDFYETQISLQEPVEYWEKKKTKHKTATIVSGIVFIALVVIFLCLFWQFVNTFEGAHGFLSFWKDATVATFGAFATGVGITIAFLRIVYRLFVSQLHLWNDSAERVTMIQTYLALAQKGHAKEEFLGALLARLFSPSSDGIVKDDIGSIGPFDSAMKGVFKN